MQMVRMASRFLGRYHRPSGYRYASRPTQAQPWLETSQLVFKNAEET